MRHEVASTQMEDSAYQCLVFLFEMPKDPSFNSEPFTVAQTPAGKTFTVERSKLVRQTSVSAQFRPKMANSGGGKTDIAGTP